MHRVNAGWRTRGYLPHYDAAGQIQHIVFRLADSLPPEVAAYLDRLPGFLRGTEAEGWLDAGHGSRLLARPDVAAVVRNVLVDGDRRDYELMAWCVMPTHVHVLVEQRSGFPLGAMVQAWKSVSAHRINHLLQRRGRLWGREYFDRAMTKDGQTDACRRYILDNPVKARLCERPEDWPWSGAAAG